MIALIQRVSKASLVGRDRTSTIASIAQGMVILCGFGNEDSEEVLEKMALKIHKLRIFSDEQGKMNHSLPKVGGSYLLASQFTLHADCRKGNRPSFAGAAPKPLAQSLYELFVEKVSALGSPTQFGPFGADLQIPLVNDGPVTLWLDSDKCL